MVLCSVSCSPLLFITLIVISHQFICDCVNFFLLIVNLLLRFRFILIMCVYLQLSSFCLFSFCLPFFSAYICIYFVRLHLSLQLPLSSLNFLSFVIHFLVMHALFNCFVLCLLHLLLPLPPSFFVFFRKHFMLFFPLYATMIAIVIIVFIIVVFGQVRIISKCL